MTEKTGIYLYNVTIHLYICHTYVTKRQKHTERGNTKEESYFISHGLVQAIMSIFCYLYFITESFYNSYFHLGCKEEKIEINLLFASFLYLPILFILNCPPQKQILHLRYFLELNTNRLSIELYCWLSYKFCILSYL